MTIAKVLPLQLGGSGLSSRARGALQTLAHYGGSRGVLAGGIRLNNSINGGTSAANDTCANIALMTGHTPAYYQWMYLDPTQSFYINAGIAAAATADYEAAIAACQAHWAAGGLVGLGMMLPNLVTGGDWNDRLRSDISAVTALLAGSSNTAAFNAWRAFLDNFANALKTRFVDAQGKPFPVFLRWFGEANGWYDYLPNEGTDPTRQVAGRKIISLARDAGGWWNLTFEARAGDYVPYVPGPGTVFQVEGNSNSAWNGNYNTRSWVSGPSGDPSGTGQTVTITAWRGRGMPNPSGAADVSAGTTIAYPQSGGWFAGLDRSAALMQLIRESVDYLRNVKGCDSLISCLALFPEQYWSTKESNTNAAGQSFDYSNWNPGASYFEVDGLDIYRPNSSPTLDAGTLPASILKHNQVQGFKPMIMHELGFAQESETSNPACAFRAQANFWPTQLGVIQSRYKAVSAFCLWSTKFIPQATDPAFSGFLSMVQSDQCVTLDNFRRLA